MTKEIIDPNTGEAIRILEKSKIDRRESNRMMAFFEDFNLEHETIGKLQAWHVTKSELATLASKAKTAELKSELAKRLSERIASEKPLIAHVLKKGTADADGGRTCIFRSEDGRLSDVPEEMNASIDRIIWGNAEFSTSFGKYLEAGVDPDIEIRIAKTGNRWEIRSIRPIDPKPGK